MTIDFILFYFLSEFVALFIFKSIRKKYLGSSGSNRPMWNGIIERVFLYLCIFTEVYHGITLFGALKIGTRIKADESKVTNDYFLIGNIISVSLVLPTSHLYKNLTI